MSTEVRQQEALNMPESVARYKEIIAIKSQYISELQKLSWRTESSLNDNEKKIVQDAREFADALASQNEQREIYKTQSTDLRHALDRHIKAATQVQQQSVAQREDVSNELVKEIKTPEQVWKVESNFWRWAESRFEVLAKLSASSKESLNEILRQPGLAQKVDVLRTLAPKDGNFVFFAWVSNYSSFWDQLQKYGYKSDGFLDDKEVVAVYTTMYDYARNQENVKTLSKEDKIKLLLNNWDGLLKVWTWEVSNLFHTLDALHLDEKKGDGFPALIENLWLGTADAFLNSMSENLFSARERFQKAFEAMNARYNITELTKKGRLSYVSAHILKEHKDFEKAFDAQLHTFFINQIDNNPTLVNVPQSTKEKFKKDFKNKFNVQALSFSHVNWVAWVWAGIDIQELTGWILDSLTVGVSEEGGLWLSVNKSLFKEKLSQYGTSVAVWISSTLAPFLWVSQRLTSDAYTSKELFELTRETSIGSTVWVSVSTGAKIATINFSKINHETSKGIEQMVSGMSELLEKWVGKDILSWSEKYSNSSATPKEQQVYEQMKSAFESATVGMTKEQKQQFMEIFLHSYVNAYRDQLYRNAEGIKLTSIWIWVISIEGFYNLPFLTIWGEKISTQKREVVRNFQRQAELTHTGVSLDRVGWKQDSIDGQKVLSIPQSFSSSKVEGWKWQIQISAPENSKAQIKIAWGKVYIGWVWLDDISIIDSTYDGKLVRTLVIWGWVPDEDGKYVWSYNSVDKITQWVRTTTRTDWISEVLVWLETNDVIQNISQDITRMISSDALPDKNTPWISALQKSIFDFRRWENNAANLDKVWSDYLKVISHPNFVKYATKDNKIDGINFLTFVDANKKVSLNEHKIYVLQSLAMALTSKWKLVAQGNTYKVEGGKKSINEYNKAHNRDAYFDTMMAKEVPNLSTSIKDARSEWNKRFGEQTSYQRFTRKTWLALSGTQVWKATGLTPLTDGYDLIGTWNQDALVKIDKLTPASKAEIVAKIPNYALEWYLKQLRALDINVVNTQWVKNFIINGWINSAKIEMDVFFAKNAQCINDAIVIDLKVVQDGKDIPLIIWAWAQSTAMLQENNTMNLGFTGWWKLEEKEKPTEPPTTPPTEPPTTVPTDSPTIPPTIPPTVPTTIPTSSPTPPPVTWTWGSNDFNNF